MAYNLGIFDMDGVLIEEVSSWVIIHNHFGVNNERSVKDYIEGRIDDFEFMRRDIALWRKKRHPLHIDDMKKILNHATFMPGAEETFRRLKERGIKTAIVSGGLLCIAKPLAERLGIDIVLANGLEVDDDGYLTGEGVLNVPLNDKGTVVRNLLKELGIKKEDSFATGNSYIDVSMFRESGLGIAFNPDDDVVRREADVVIEEKDLKMVLEHVED